MKRTDGRTDAGRRPERAPSRGRAAAGASPGRAGLIAALALLLAAGSAHAQERFGGVKGSMDLATVAGDDAYDASGRRGVGFGAFVVLPIDERLSFQPELLYVNKGARFAEEGFAYGVKLGYAEIPFLARLSLGDPYTDGIDPFLLFGPTIAFKLSCRLEARDSRFDISAGCNEDDEFRIKRFDYGLAVGGGISIPVRGVDLVFDARYNLGLTTMDDSADVADVRHRVFSAMTGVSIPLQRRWPRR